MKLKELHETKLAEPFENLSVKDLNIKYISGTFNCVGTGIKSLKGSPMSVENFSCDNNELTSLVGGPKFVERGYSCSENKLTSLEGAPVTVGTNFVVRNNKLTSLEGAPTSIGLALLCGDNELTNLKNIHKQINFIGRHADFHNNPIKSHVLGLLLIDNLTQVILDNREVQGIINDYLATSRDVFDCQNELMDAGLDEYAQL
jgi:hypothetical protein